MPINLMLRALQGRRTLYDLVVAPAQHSDKYILFVCFVSQVLMECVASVQKFSNCLWHNQEWYVALGFKKGFKVILAFVLASYTIKSANVRVMLSFLCPHFRNLTMRASIIDSRSNAIRSTLFQARFISFIAMSSRRSVNMYCSAQVFNGRWHARMSGIEARLWHQSTLKLDSLQGSILGCLLKLLVISPPYN